MHAHPQNGSHDPSETLVFVYGRMRRGEADHHFLKGARHVADIATAALFELVDLGGLPGLIEGGDCAIEGEVYAVSTSTLAMIDELEDHPESFRRTRIELADGTFAQGYLVPRAQAGCFPRCTEHRWRRRA